MTGVAIIAEYNPFHTGHQYHIQSVRDELGADVTVIAIMSGNFTQRGTLAIADKRTRAECAIRGGVDLVVELPFPHSIASAEHFARAGVTLAHAMRARYLSFGSECGDVTTLTATAELLRSERYLDRLRTEARLPENRHLGHAALAERVFCELTGGLTDLFSPNNTLGLEYIKAILAEGLPLCPHTIRRRGASYREELLTDSPYQSAAAIRQALLQDDPAAWAHLPIGTQQTLRRAQREGLFPIREEALSTARLASLRLNPTPLSAPADAADGLYNRLQTLSLRADSITALTALAETRKFTRARIRRVLWYSYLGVTSSEMQEKPLYTQILGMNNRGKAYLRSLSGKAGLPLLTKPSATATLSDAARRQKATADRADAIQDLALPTPRSGISALTLTPFVLCE